MGEDATLTYDPGLSTDLTESPVRCYSDKMYDTDDFVFYKGKPPYDISDAPLSPAYKGRTKLSDEALKRGIISLTLTRDRKSVV